MSELDWPVSREWEIDEAIKPLIRKMVHGAATEEDRAEYQALMAERVDLMIPEVLRRKQIVSRFLIRDIWRNIGRQFEERYGKQKKPRPVPHKAEEEG